MSILKIGVGWFFLITSVLYFVFLINFVRDLKKNQQNYWKEIGDPSNTDLVGQVKILRLIFYPGVFPANIIGNYKKKIVLIRLFAALALLGFASMCLMITICVYD
ncbi:hypothetical protein ACFONN_17260 [Dyella humi]|uniref:DUF1634 domain-containing protein n=1 Tax=Dyella humi TaxID=1770547 RepID=A0ABW8IE05_9GAMM